MADKKRNGKKRTTETVKATIERLRGYNAGRLERIKELKKLINADNAKIRRLERLYGTINQDELREKIETMLFKDKKMTEEQIVAFIEQFYKETALDIPTDTTEKQTAPQAAEPDNEDNADTEDNEDGTE